MASAFHQKQKVANKAAYQAPLLDPVKVRDLCTG